MFTDQQTRQPHLVRFYQDDDYLIAGLAAYIGDALAGGNKGVAIATRDHLDRLDLRLRRRGVDLPAQLAAGRYAPIEAERLLPLFMADGLPDKARFRDTIGNLIRRAVEDGDGRLYICGEIVAILSTSERGAMHALGKHQAAIHVEHFFNELQRQYPFSLLCAYPLSSFPREEDRGTFCEVCALHTEVLPAENFDLGASVDQIKRNVAELQQQAFALASAVYDRKQVERALHEVNFDRLTGLPNRSVFNDRLEMDLRKSERTHLPVALLFVDLDHFKEINDTLGHASGDLLLKQVAHRLSSHVRKSDTVTRLGGDEFTVTLAELHDVDTVTDVAQKILDDLARPFQLGNEVAYISGSIGITLYPQDAGSAAELLRNADQAMYESKNQGRNRFAYFTPSMQQAAQARMAISKDLRRALGGQQLRVHYQPIVDLHDGRICKAEALLRWFHPVKGEVSPDAFIPVAEHTGMIVAIGNWVFGEALRQAAHWRVAQPDFSVSVNVSPVQFYRNKENTCRQWLKHLRGTGRAADGSEPAVSLEITEGLLLSADDDVMDKLAAFHGAGIKIALDDFGTGYSSLSYLRKFNVDYLKIDQSFVADLEHDPADVALCEAIIVMAHKLGLKVIAEGIETAAQRELLRGAGCDYGQGFHFGHPIDAVAFDMLLRARSREQSSAHLRYS